MKNVKLLYRLLIFINLSTTVLIGIQIIMLVIPDLYNSKPYDDYVLGSFNNLILTGLLVIIVTGSFKIQQGIKYIINEGFFNSVSEFKFRSAGLIFIIFAICRIVYVLIIMSEFELSELINNLVMAFLVVLVGMGLFIFSDFIKNGGVLKEENDLTI
ncbi:MAG: hypothetical protein V7719_00505 [Psychroserpens sp.]|uniref:hypothetical protein n=1 Tax=Psychroserpens sp. TaxID=2020870 RepID=UPI003001E79D